MPRGGSLLERAPGVPRQARVDLPADERRTSAGPPPPDGWVGGPARWAIYWAHGPLGRGEPGVLWNYRVPLFGGIDRLGFVNDFVEYDLGVAIDVIDPREGGGELASIVALRFAIMAHFSYRYVVIDHDRALTAPIAMLRDALAGVSRSTLAA